MNSNEYERKDSGQEPSNSLYYSTYSGYSSYQPLPEPVPVKPRRNPAAAKMVAGLLAVVLVSSAAGGGAAYWVLKSQPTALIQAQGTTVQQASALPTVVEPGSIAAVVQSTADSVVEIDTKATQENFFVGRSVTQGAGSGVIVSADGYIVTNNHVVQATDSMVVRTKDGTEYDAVLVGTDPKTDLAVLKVNAEGLKAATFADSDQILVGDLAVAIGNPLGELGGTVTNGIISATGREITIDGATMTLLQTSAAVNPGNSGGGLFDASGRLVGVVNAKSTGVDVEGLAFAIPANTVREVVDQIVANGYVSGRPEMGIKVLEVGDARTAAMYGVDRLGIYVADPGSNQGLQSGDRLVFMDGESVATTSDVGKVLQNHAVGDTIKMTVERDGKEVQTEVTLTEQTPQQEIKANEPL